MTLVQRTVIVFILVGYITCQSLNDIDVDEVKNAIEKGIGENLPALPDLSEFNATNIPSAEDVENVMREKCEKNGAPDAVDLLKEEQDRTVECLESYINMTEIQEELEKSKSTGSMDEVFSKYCNKWPDMHGCFDNVTSIARQCMDKREEAALNKTMEILNELQTFMCFKGGDRLAMFWAEKGPDCLQEKKDGIETCLNKTLGSRMPKTDELSVANLPVLLFTEQDCDDFETVRGCINVELEKCKNSTPANIIDALFKFLKKHLPCSAALKQGNSAAYSSSIGIFTLIAAFMYVRLF